MDLNQPKRAARIRLYLPSICVSVRGDQVLEDPVLAAVVVEDMCWGIARDAWLARKPRPWRRRKVARWSAEHEALHEQRERIKCFAQECGLLASR